MRACMTLSDDQNKNANEVKELQCVCDTTIKLYMSRMMSVVIFSPHITSKSLWRRIFLSTGSSGRTLGTLVKAELSLQQVSFL